MGAPVETVRICCFCSEYEYSWTWTLWIPLSIVTETVYVRAIFTDLYLHATASFVL